MSSFDFTTYLSPFTWRYGSEKMRKIFSEQHKYELWRKIWVALANAQHRAGLVTAEELADLEKNQDNIDIEKILEIEKDTKHDVVAAIKEFASKAPIGGGKIHLGATSMDVVDNTDAIRVKEALELIEKKIVEILHLFAEKIEKYAAMPCLGYTHLQPAEPTTVGYRLAFYAQDVFMDYHLLQFVKERSTVKGLKGAVGTSASYLALLKKEKSDLESNVMESLGLKASLITTQVNSRKHDYRILTTLTSIASSLAKFAGDVRMLQAPNIGEWAEPFGSQQVGSSAMPFKKNPVNAEKICSLARMIAAYPQIALENATLSYLERTLDDSANRRVIIPEAFLATDEILNTSKKIIEGLIINEKRIAYNLSLYAPFVASEGILLATVKSGADRQGMHEVLRKTAMQAWEEIQTGKENPMKQLLLENTEIKKYISADELDKLFDVAAHIGTAKERALQLAEDIKRLGY